MKYYVIISIFIFLQLILFLSTDVTHLFIAPSFLMICILFGFIWRILYILKNIHNMRSVISLFAHMLQSNISGLRIFLSGLAIGETIDKKTIDIAQIAATELYCINQRIQELSRLTWGPDMISLAHLLNKTVKKHPCVHLIMDDATQHIKVPAAPFHLIIDELIMNAREAAAPDAQVILETLIVKSLFRKTLNITISDNGIGMTHDILHKVENPFFSTRDGSHLGLGLTCCKELMHFMSGELEIISAPGKGTLIRLSYPMKQILEPF